MSQGRMALAVGIGAGLLLACRQAIPHHPLEPVIVSLADSLSFQATGFRGVTDVRDYHWYHPGGTAMISHESALRAGAGAITVLDGGGRRIYSAPLASTDTVQTEMGSPGVWIVRVSLTEASGTLRFRMWPGSYRATP